MRGRVLVFRYTQVLPPILRMTNDEEDEDDDNKSYSSVVVCLLKLAGTTSENNRNQAEKDEVFHHWFVLGEGQKILVRITSPLLYSRSLYFFPSSCQ